MKRIKMLPGVTIPEAGLVIDRTTGKRSDLYYTMKEWLDDVLHSHEKFGKGLAGISQGLKIKKIYENVKPGRSFELEEADYNEVHQAMEDAKFNPIMGMGCIDYYKALDEATGDESKKTVKKGKR